MKAVPSLNLPVLRARAPAEAAVCREVIGLVAERMARERQAKLYEPSVKRKKLGLLKRKVRVADDFNAPLSHEIIASFEGH